MVDIETHRVVDLIPSRETGDVTEWLKTYPSLEVVSRDGSVSYNNAIRQAGTGIVQISDRFHLLKGLAEAAKKHITQEVKANFRIPVSMSHYGGVESADYWKVNTPEDFSAREHGASVRKKIQIINHVKELKEKGCTNVEIAAELGISTPTVAQYLKPGFNPENGLYNTTRPSKIKPYAGEIKELLAAGRTFKQIETAIREKGYDGIASTIRMYATRERKLMKEACTGKNGGVEKIERKWLINLLYKPTDQVKEITLEQLGRVIEAYPVIGRLYDIVKSFKEILFSKKPGDLEKWIEEAETLGIDEINSFIVGLNRDKEAVKKAIELEYNNGLAEGSVNKLKLIKRIMYGRNSFNLLKSKLLRLELRSKIN